MKIFLVLVEPLRLRAVNRWLDQQRVLLICSRVFRPPVVEPTLAILDRRRRSATPAPAAPDLFRVLHRPDSFRGRALDAAALLEAYPLLQTVQPGDLLIVPNLPRRACLSVHRVGPGGLVAGSSATSALPLGFAVAESRGVTSPVVTDLKDRAALIASLPFPEGPITALTALGPAWAPLFG